MNRWVILRRRLWVGVVGAVGLLGSQGTCGKEAEPVGQPVVVGKHVVITDSDLVWYGIPLASLTPAQREQVLEEWRNQVALYEEARARGYLERPDVQRRLKLVEVSALASWMLEDLGKETAPSAEAFDRFLQGMGDLFRIRANVVAVYVEDTTRIPQVRQILRRRWALDGILKALERVPDVQPDVAREVVLGEWVVSHFPDSLWSRVTLPQRSLEVQGPFRLGGFWVLLRISEINVAQDYLLPLERIRAFFFEHERMKRQEALLDELKARHLAGRP